ncbi:alpha kinase/elongation factor 2 kinase [Anaeramoeba flamelloides]|uniref:Alpha kinase/elongation factor 2 kinase n=1 Tax=Anaeramoeba flamelloides TaxID=1746091 RepID=A0ABQ8Y0X1_9EUKA|nr:alpha kinase/elongation factor 2 kinase [Anaeramoeba flamelloides]
MTDLLNTDEDKYIYSVSIDFGTSQSGYAYGILGDQAKEVHGMANRKVKVDSSILLKRSEPGFTTDTGDDVELIETVAFGDEAIELYQAAHKLVPFINEETFEIDEEEYKEMKIQEKKLPKDKKKQTYWYDELELFQFYKMRLYEGKKFALSQKGLRFPLNTVISFALRHISDLAMEHLNNQEDEKNIREITKQNTFWVLTVPAIWKEESKYLMRKCAKKAGIIEKKDSKSLVLIREPEAAAIEYFFNPNSKSFQNFKKEKFLLFDAGSGTIDMTVLETSGSVDNPQLRITIPAKGSPNGSSVIDKAFLDFVIEFSQQTEEKKSNMPIQFLDCFKDWLNVKHNAKSEYKTNEKKAQETIQIKIPQLLMKSDIQLLLDNWNVGKNKKDLEFLTKARNKNEIKMKRGYVHQLFEKAMLDIIKNVEDVFNGHPQEKKDVTTILMAGGFSSSDILFRSIEKTFTSKNWGKKVILVSNLPEQAVIFGAVRYGLMEPKQRKTIFASRPLAYGYGLQVFSNFDRSIHKKDKMIKVEGRELCKDVYRPLIDKNQPIKAEEEISGQTFEAMSKNFEIVICQTDQKLDENTVYYTDDPIIHKFGSTIIKDVNTSSSSRPVTIELLFTFSGEMVKVTAQNVHTEIKYRGKIKYHKDKTESDLEQDEMNIKNSDETSTSDSDSSTSFSQNTSSGSSIDSDNSYSSNTSSSSNSSSSSSESSD